MTTPTPAPADPAPAPAATSVPGTATVNSPQVYPYPGGPAPDAAAPADPAPAEMPDGPAAGTVHDPAAGVYLLQEPTGADQLSIVPRMSTQLAHPASTPEDVAHAWLVHIEQAARLARQELIRVAPALAARLAAGAPAAAGIAADVASVIGTL